MPEVTDPDLLRRLNEAAVGQEVTDPALIERLNVASTEQAAQPERSIFGRIADTLGAPSPYAPTDPSGANATIGRVATGIIGGIPDLAIKFQNAGLNPFDMVGAGVDKLLGTTTPTAKIPEITPLLRQATGTPELPEDASTARHFLEGAAQVAGSGGARGVGLAIQGAPTATAAILPAAGAVGRNIVAPIVGAEAGGAIGEKIGGERGQLIGSLLGGAVAPQAPQIARAGAERYYGSKARPDAAEIAATARRQGVEPTPGMLGNKDIQQTERALSGRAGSAGTINEARERARVQIRDAAERGVAQRQQIPAATPETNDIISTAQKAQAAGADVSSAVQQRLVDQIGNRAAVDIGPVVAKLNEIISKTDPGTAKPIANRVADLINMVEINPNTGNLAMPNGRMEIPYERFKDWRTNLGKQMQGQDPVPGRFLGDIYEAATNSMKDTAARAGVHPDAFDAAQAITKNQFAAGKIAPQVEKTLGSERVEGTESAAGPRQYSRWWETLPAEKKARYETVVGPQGPQTPVMSDVSRLARAFNYPTNQVGMTRSVGSAVGEGINRALGMAGGAALGSMFGPAGSAIGAVSGAAVPTAVNALRARMLQNIGVPAMSGQRTAIRPMTIQDLIAAMQAARIGAP